MGTVRFILAIASMCWLSACNASNSATLSQVAPPQPSDAPPAMAAKQPAPTAAAKPSSGRERCSDEHLLFHCETKNGKEIMLCDNGTTIDYSFGSPEKKADIALSVPRTDATTYQWQGMGRWISYSVTVPNGNTKYTVFTSVDRLTDEHEFKAGVTATVDEKVAAEILCKEPITHRLDGVDLKPDE